MWAIEFEVNVALGVYWVVLYNTIEIRGREAPAQNKNLTPTFCMRWADSFSENTAEGITD